VDGAPTFTGEYRRGAPVMREMAAARCSRRLKIQKEWMIRSFFRRIAAFKIGRAEVSQKYVTTSDHPSQPDRYCPRRSSQQRQRLKLISTNFRCSR
jgi:hypothetical protein